jgi:signal transduction histidine kinase
MTKATKPTLTEPEQEPVSFVADARLISVLGEQLIGSEKVGVLELVKNAYDAGATECVVTLEGVPDLPPTGRVLAEYAALPGPIIEIRDDGSGMTKTDLIEGWLRPATSRRARVKEQLRVEREAAKEKGNLAEFNALLRELRDAHNGRLPVGEKGVGRLATHRLGTKLWLRTKTADDPFEWQLKIDWDDFDALTGGLVDLSSVKLNLIHQPPTTSYGRFSRGTVICCYGGRPGYEWSEDAIIDVGRAINALRSPYRTPSGFSPRFVSPHVPETALASPLERVPAPFEFLAIVDEEGVAEIDMSFHPPAALAEVVEPYRAVERIDLRHKDLAHWKSTDGLRSPASGPFLIHIRAWVRMKAWMGPDYKQLTRYLDEFGGLTVFRDGLAALPAQQSAKGDWLGLSIKQIKKSSNISYYHMTGEIEVSQENSFDLRDRSSREGMIETQPYRDFTALTRAAVYELQQYMQGTRDRWKRAIEGEPISFAAMRRDLGLAADIGDTIAENYDFDRDPLRIGKLVKKGGPKQAIEALRRVRRLESQLKLQHEERDALLEAAGFGLAVNVGVHEIGRLASAIASDLRRMVLGKQPKVERDALEGLEEKAEALLAEVKRLAPLRVTRTETAKVISVRAAIEAARSAFSYAMEKQKVHWETGGEDFKIEGRFGALSQVFANLVDNALYWMGTGRGQRQIKVMLNVADRTVLFADSGPGISPKIKPYLFQPFYSEKSPPSGLGLYISRYYVAQMGGSIRLANATERAELSGAQFLLEFPEPKN